MKLFPLISIALLLLISCTEDGVNEVIIDSGSNIEKRVFKINTEYPENHSIKIINKKKSPVSLKMIFNGNRIYGTLDDIIKDIKEMPDEFESEPIVRKVWRFTTQHSKHGHPLTDSAFYHIPQLFFNSTGFGYCDDRSMVNNFLWRILGYESRVWGLANHVVSEVLVNGKWEMYDSMQEVYYKTKKGEVASVQDILDDPEIVLHPIDPVIEFDETIPNAYTEEVLKCYLYPGIYSVEPNIPKIDFQPDIYLGNNYYIQFPFKQNKDLATAVVNNNKQERTLIKDFAIMSFTITERSQGIIPYPFFIHSIEGKGNVRFNDTQSFQIGSKELDDKINKWDAFLFPIFFQSLDTLRINYLINPHRFSLKEENTLIIYGEEIDSIEVQLKENL